MGAATRACRNGARARGTRCSRRRRKGGQERRGRRNAGRGKRGHRRAQADALQPLRNDARHLCSWCSRKKAGKPLVQRAVSQQRSGNNWTGRPKEINTGDLAQQTWPGQAARRESSEVCACLRVACARPCSRAVQCVRALPVLRPGGELSAAELPRRSLRPRSLCGEPHRRRACCRLLSGSAGKVFIK